MKRWSLSTRWFRDLTDEKPQRHVPRHNRPNEPAARNATSTIPIVQSPSEFDEAFAKIVRERAEALSSCKVRCSIRLPIRSRSSQQLIESQRFTARGLQKLTAA